MKVNELYKYVENKIFDFDYIIKNGILDEEMDINLVYWIYLHPKNRLPYNGITYSLYDNDNLESYTMYNNGIENGQEVEFYSNGNIKSYCENINRCLNNIYCEFDKNKNCTVAKVFNNGKLWQVN